MDMKALKLLLKGRVQRVGLRRFCLELAQELGLSGRIRNLPNGSVEMIIQGEKGKLDEFLSSLERAPRPISIRDISKEEIEVDPSLEYFSVEFGSLEEELQEGFGAMHSVFLEYWGEFREFSRRTDENFKLLTEEIREVGRKVDSVGEKVEEVGRKVDSVGEKVEEVGRKVDSVGEKVDSVRDEIVETREEVIRELRGSREDFREFLSREISEMRREISEIKEALKREGII